MNIDDMPAGSGPVKDGPPEPAGDASSPSGGGVEDAVPQPADQARGTAQHAAPTTGRTGDGGDGTADGQTFTDDAGTGAGSGTGRGQRDWSPPPPPPPPSPPPGPVRRLRRSREHRMVAGVAGGIADHLGLDPVVARVAFAVLAVFGGAGVLLYLLCWFLMPDEGEEYAPVDTLFGRGHRQGPALGEAVLAATAALVLAVVLVRHHLDDVVLLVVVLAMAFLLFRHLDGRTGGTAFTRADDPDRTPDADDPWPGDPDTPRQRRFGSQPRAGEPGAAPAAGPPAWRSTERSLLGVVAFCLACVLIGVLVAVDRATPFALSPRGLLALVLAVLGAALLVGARWGRARGLIGLGVPIALVLMLAGGTLSDGWSARDRVWAPTSAGAVRDEYRLGAGRAVLDLRSVDFTAANVRTTVRIGAGVLRIEVPSDVDVVARSVVTAGSVHVFDTWVDGLNRSTSVTDTGRDGPGGGRLELQTLVDFGYVEVTR